MEIYEKLGLWFEKEKRDLPWRSTSDPYSIWLSEIILQQTRVAQGTDYYLRFLEKFPDIFSLANAELNEVLKIWQGLGYYSRARNLHETARFIGFQKNGQFPDSYHELLNLKGIGEYSAAAISSIAFNEPRAAVDGNVKRVISRLFAVIEEVNSPEGKKIISSLANEILDKENPGRHNQAVMELGACICLPTKPLCISCPLNSVCLALKEEKVSDLPLIYKKPKVKDRFFNYLVMKNDDRIILQKRTGGEIWEGLYEFPLVETDRLVEINEYPGLLATKFHIDGNYLQITTISDLITHKLSHRNIITRFLHITVSRESDFSAIAGNVVQTKDFHDYPVPKLLERYICASGF